MAIRIRKGSILSKIFPQYTETSTPAPINAQAPVTSVDYYSGGQRSGGENIVGGTLHGEPFSPNPYYNPIPTPTPKPTPTPTGSGGGGGGGGLSGEPFSPIPPPVSPNPNYVPPPISTPSNQTQIQEYFAKNPPTTLTQQQGGSGGGFTGVVEQYQSNPYPAGARADVLQERQYLAGGKTLFVYKNPEQREGKITNYVLKKKKGQVVEIEETREQPTEESFYYRSFPSLTGIKYYRTTPEGNITTQFTSEEVKKYNLTPTEFEIANTLPSTKPAGFYRGVEYEQRKYTTETNKLLSKGAVGNITIGERIKLGFLGAGLVIGGQILGTETLFKKGGIKEYILGIPSGIKQEASILGTSLASPTPEYALGRIGGYYATGKAIEYGGKGVVKGVDYVRTTTTKNLPLAYPETEMFMRRQREVFYIRNEQGQFLQRKYSIVAPEYFQGQTYPAIAKGQTAGELLKEFYKPNLPNEPLNTPKGFTASPKPFSRNLLGFGKKATAGTGSSELPGVYQAPKISPAFFRIGRAETPGFTLNPFGTLRPTATIIYPKTLKLMEGVKYSQRSLAPLGKAKAFFSNKAKLGESYIPFVKTEKESITTAESPLVYLGTRYSFDLEGRRIPIQEFKEVDINEIPKGTKTFTSEEVSSMSSRGLGGGGSNPYNIPINFKSYSYTSSGGYKSYSSYSSVSSSRSIPSIPRSSATSRASSTSYLSSRISSYAPRSSSRSYNPFSRVYYPGGRSYRNPPISPKTTLTPPRIHAFEYPSIPKGFGGFNVYVRRGGIFKPVGTGLSLGKAFNLGRGLTEYGLGQSFKIRGIGGEVPSLVPKGYYPKKEKKEGLIFIEQPKTKINTGMEKSLLALARGMKGGKRK